MRVTAHRSAELSGQWRESLQQYLTGRIILEALMKGDQERSYVVTGWFGYLAGYRSSICFCAGSAIGLVLTFVALMHFANPIQPDVYRSNWSSGLQTGQPDFLPGR